MPLIVWTERKIALTGSSPPVPRSSSSREWLMAETCSRLSVRKSSAYWALSTRVSRDGRKSSGPPRRPEGRDPARANAAGQRWDVLLASPQHALHGFEHATGLERLHHEVLGAGLNRLDDERLLPHRAAHQHLRVRIELGDLADGVDSAQCGHHDFHRDEVGLELLVLPHRLHARLRLSHDLESRLLQDVADHGAHEDRVVADQNRMTHSIAPLEQDLRDQRMNVDEDDDVAVEMTEPPHQPAAGIATARARVHRLLGDRAYVHHLVHRDADDARAVLGENDGAARIADLRVRPVEPRAEIEHRDDRPTEVDQSLHVRRRTR